MWQKLSLITRHWDAVERFTEQHPKGPWWLSVTASGPRELPYSAMPTAWRGIDASRFSASWN